MISSNTVEPLLSNGLLRDYDVIHFPWKMENNTTSLRPFRADNSIMIALIKYWIDKQKIAG